MLGISAVAINYFQFLGTKKGILFAGKRSYGVGQMTEEKAGRTRRKAFKSLFLSCHMKAEPAITTSQLELVHICSWRS